MEPRPYQTNGINQLAQLAANGRKRLLFQLATGGGKTVCFSVLIHRYLQRQNKKVLILVHREELLKQARRTLYDWYQIIAAPVVAGVRDLPEAQVYVAMVETANNRLRKNAGYFKNVGLVIIDEAHLGNFRKLLAHFPDTLTIGFTATPISASKKEPLKNMYDEIVCGIDIPELITNGSLMPNRTYHVKNVNRKELKIKNGEFDESWMADMMSKPKHVENTITGYERFALNTKTLVFNCNVEHSKLVAAAFVSRGYDARHLDANSTNRASTIEWFKQNPNAILCNVGILTTGFDEPTVQSIIVNKSTMSLPLWLQMTGRGSRPTDGKTYFTIVDMGGNALTHGDWSDSRDWSDYFHYPEKPSSGNGVAPVKICGSCEAIMHASKKICPVCGAENIRAVNYDEELVEFEELTKSKPLDVNVHQIIEVATDKNDYYALHQIKTSIIQQARYRWSVKVLSDPLAAKLLAMYQVKVKEWCKAKGKRYNTWHVDVTTQWFNTELQRIYNWQPAKIQEAA